MSLRNKVCILCALVGLACAEVTWHEIQSVLGAVETYQSGQVKIQAIPQDKIEGYKNLIIKAGFSNFSDPESPSAKTAFDAQKTAGGIQFKHNYQPTDLGQQDIIKLANILMMAYIGDPTAYSDPARTVQPFIKTIGSTSYIIDVAAYPGSVYQYFYFTLYSFVNYYRHPQITNKINQIRMKGINKIPLLTTIPFTIGKKTLDLDPSGQSLVITPSETLSIDPNELFKLVRDYNQQNPKIYSFTQERTIGGYKYVYRYTIHFDGEKFNLTKSAINVYQ